MKIYLQKATSVDAQTLLDMQVRAFFPILEKYKDHETNPACKSLEYMIERINNPSKGFFKILTGDDNTLVGGIGIKHINSDTVFLGPIFIDPAFQNQKFAQRALGELENLLQNVKFFELATIVQEVALVCLYEKIGYVPFGELKTIQEGMDIVYLRKKLR